MTVGNFVGDVFTNLVANLVASGITTIGLQTFQGARKVLSEAEILKKRNRINLIVRTGISNSIPTLKSDDDVLVERIYQFLLSPAAESIVRQIYSSHITNNHLSITSIRQEFLLGLTLYTGYHVDQVVDVADSIFDILQRGCEHALEEAIDKGVLLAHEARSVQRFRMLQDELDSIQKNLAFLIDQKRINVQEILKYEQEYRQQVTNRHGYIIPADLDGRQKIPIDELYVTPRFIIDSDTNTQEPITLNFTQFLRGIYRAVLLGNPGGGKSTLADKVCHTLSASYSSRTYGFRQVTPIHVVLRDYGAVKRESKCSILQFIELTAISKYQTFTPPENSFAYLLLNGHMVVIFDGLDELLDTSYRKEISDDVESFCNRFPSVPVLVTSREVGYSEAPLDQRRFTLFKIASFDDDQVKQYAQKWFKLSTDLSNLDREERITSFLRESLVVPDLRANPLMLSLMCNIYRGANYIPKNRPEVYEKCALMLFERWDKSRGIRIPHEIETIEAHLREMMTDLAYWVYTNSLSEQGGAIEGQLVEQAARYLYPRRFEDLSQATKVARDFISFCRGRAWILVEAGTTPDGDRIYQFAHRTFLEYFTANYFVTSLRTYERLLETLLPKVEQNEADVVAQLAVQIQSKIARGSDDDMLIAIIEYSAHKKEEGWRLLAFATRCLTFLFPSLRVIREVTTACLTKCVSFTLDSEHHLSNQFRRIRDLKYQQVVQPRYLLQNLLSISNINKNTIVKTIESWCIEYINDRDDNESLIALELILSINIIVSHTSTTLSARRDRTAWIRIFENVYNICKTRIDFLYSKEENITIISARYGRISIERVMNLHGVKIMLIRPKYQLYPTISNRPLIYKFIDIINMSSSKNIIQENALQIQKVGQLLLSSGLILSSPDSIRGNRLTLRIILTNTYRDKLLNHGMIETYFYSLIIAMAIFEVRSYYDHNDRTDSLLLSILNSRIQYPNTLVTQESLEEFGFNFEQTQVITHWTSNYLSFVKYITELAPNTHYSETTNEEQCLNIIQSKDVEWTIQEEDELDETS